MQDLPGQVSGETPDLLFSLFSLIKAGIERSFNLLPCQERLRRKADKKQRL